jgi:hypothetical protein
MMRRHVRYNPRIQRVIALLRNPQKRRSRFSATLVKQFEVPYSIGLMEKP